MRGLTGALPRTLIVGLDGATPELLFEGIARGELPTLADLQRRAAWGPLRSTLPPMTLPAWSSFLTGCPPDVHGIFDFVRRERGTGRLRRVDAGDRAVPTIPRQLSDRGLRVGTFLFPTTWPPEPLTGGQISGFDSPVATRVPREACSPRSLHDLVRATLGRDLAYADFSELRKGSRWEERATAALLSGIADKERVARALLADGPPYDVFALLFGESDTVSHHFWHLMDTASPRHLPELAARHGDAVRAVYRRLDAAVGALVAADDWDAVIIASDHGFGGASDRALHVNAFLADQGFLTFEPSRRAAGRWPHRLAGALPPAWLERLVRAAPDRVVDRLDERSRWGSVDLRRSFAFCDELDYCPAIRLNLQGRDPHGPVPAEPAAREALVRGIERALLGWRDPFDGGPVVEAVHRASVLYPGPLGDRAPDLLLELRCPGGYSYTLARSRPGDASVVRLGRAAWRGAKGAGMPGSHRRDGIFLLAGPGVQPGRAAMEIADLLPAWLAAAGVQLGPRPPAWRPAEVADADPAALQQRLRSLGYLR